MRFDLKIERKLAAGAVTLATILAGLVPSTGFGHARLKLGSAIPPRSTSAGLKIASCGGISRTATPTKLVAGQQVTIEIEEVIDHPGYYRIAFSNANDVFPPAIPVPTEVTPASDILWVPYIKDLPNVHAYSATVTVPNVECTQCSIQMIQYMTENDPPTMYYSCADIEISKAAAPSPTPSPVPMPSGDCN
jgi:hypothetical protein